MGETRGNNGSKTSLAADPVYQSLALGVYHGAWMLDMEQSPDCFVCVDDTPPKPWLSMGN